MSNEQGATKYDQGKAPVASLALSYFPKALTEIARVSEFGAQKYAEFGWRKVDRWYARYMNAMVRHLLTELDGEERDPESSLRHAAHMAWNALALLEMLIREEDGRLKNALAGQTRGTEYET